MEPWDGPAALAFSDGHLVGVALDRNGLRPCRYFLTDYALVVAGSEAGLVDLDPEKIIHSGRLGPGEMLVADLDAHQLLEDDQLLKEFDRFTAYGKLVEDTPLEPAAFTTPVEELTQIQQAFGYTREDVRMVLAPMASDGKDAVWSMGDDTPLAPLAHAPRPVYAFFRQRFAQVTNPAIDPVRESIVIELHTRLGPWPHLLDTKARSPAFRSNRRSCRWARCMRCAIASIRSPTRCRWPSSMRSLHQHAISAAPSTTFVPARSSWYAVAPHPAAHRSRPAQPGARSEVLPIPMALATGAVHHALVRSRRAHPRWSGCRSRRLP